MEGSLRKKDNSELEVYAHRKPINEYSINEYCRVLFAKIFMHAIFLLGYISYLKLLMANKQTRI
jgi:hypothetical protein